jgi:transposase
MMPMLVGPPASDCGMMNDDVAESAHPTGRMSARMQRIELISRRERHRQWTVEQKRAAVEEMLAPGAKVTDVARRYEISTGQLYTWRRLMLDGKLGELQAAAPSFVRVDLVGALPQVEGSEPLATRAALEGAQPAPESASAQPHGIIEIELTCGTRVRVDGGVDGRALGCVLRALANR